MKKIILYAASAIVIAVPWLFLLEILPIPYYRIGTALEIILECIMFAALLTVVILLRKEIRRLRPSGKREMADVSGAAHTGSRSGRVVGRILFLLSSVTLFVVGLILLLIAVSFTL